MPDRSEAVRMGSGQSARRACRPPRMRDFRADGQGCPSYGCRGRRESSRFRRLGGVPSEPQNIEQGTPNIEGGKRTSGSFLRYSAVLYSAVLLFAEKKTKKRSIPHRLKKRLFKPALAAVFAKTLRRAKGREVCECGRGRCDPFALLHSPPRSAMNQRHGKPVCVHMRVL